MTAKCFYSDLTFGYTCTVTSIHIDRTGVVMQFEGKHLKHRIKYDVKHLCIRDKMVKYFPRDLRADFPHLTHITIENCGLLKISSIDLLGLEYLQYLHLEKNLLTSLPDNLFHNTRQIREINFDNNQLQTVSGRILDPIPNIECISVQNNPGINVYLNKNELSSGKTCTIKSFIFCRLICVTFAKVSQYETSENSVIVSKIRSHE